MAEIKIERLTPEAFAPFGRVLTIPAGVESGALDRPDLDVWMGISDLMGLEKQEPVLTMLKCTRHNLPVNKIERHVTTAEAFIPLEGESVMIVAPVSDPNDPNAMPDESQLRAFILDGSMGVFLPRGSWHWAPFPLRDDATFILLFDKNINDDIEIRDIGPHTLKLY